MNEETFNMSLRKYLKRVGVTSQQEIEKAVRAAAAAGTLPEGPLQATVTLTVAGIALSHVVKGEIALEGDAE
ncbi:hypothetical protein FDP22_12010 [Paroceanicella profunda]|uniref:Uncharacterized protein n=1 Tax=Paroceanicella profunda TaxID=2579971 RepID=A0A5B8FYJ7_9RHOB|nr:DUF6494 family protein [Paroceanicella profunda]QDL92440.1 hypothetical protein FDP22_12010 [Paroceanicella profunda]